LPRPNCGRQTSSQPAFGRFSGRAFAGFVFYEQVEIDAVENGETLRRMASLFASTPAGPLESVRFCLGFQVDGGMKKAAPTDLRTHECGHEEN
jgi:hypothetical protein